MAAITDFNFPSLGGTTFTPPTVSNPNASMPWNQPAAATNTRTRMPMGPMAVFNLAAQTPVSTPATNTPATNTPATSTPTVKDPNFGNPNYNGVPYAPWYDPNNPTAARYDPLGFGQNPWMSDATFMNNFEGTSAPYSGVSQQHFATEDAARRLAQIFGTTYYDAAPTTGPYRWSPQYTLANGMNVGLVLRQLQIYPEQVLLELAHRGQPIPDQLKNLPGIDYNLVNQAYSQPYSAPPVQNAAPVTPVNNPPVNNAPNPANPVTPPQGAFFPTVNNGNNSNGNFLSSLLGLLNPFTSALGPTPFGIPGMDASQAVQFMTALSQLLGLTGGNSGLLSLLSGAGITPNSNANYALTGPSQDVRRNLYPIFG